MPRKPRGEEIVEAVRQCLTVAVQEEEPITDGRLMKAAGCSRAPFYKYVTEGSEIRREINAAKALQKSKPRPEGGEPAEPDLVLINKALRRENEQLKVALRGLEAYIVRLISNLSEWGVSPTILQEAQTEPMSKPDRRYPTRGRSRSRKNRRRPY
jgi:hypothetical protein